jgi:CubicO group peptidase (beta-lactamase class C family)
MGHSKNLWAALVFTLFAFTYTYSATDWSAVDKSVMEAIGSRVFPGCVIVIGNATTTLY